MTAQIIQYFYSMSEMLKNEGDLPYTHFFREHQIPSTSPYMVYEVGNFSIIGGIDNVMKQSIVSVSLLEHNPSNDDDINIDKIYDNMEFKLTSLISQMLEHVRIKQSPLMGIDIHSIKARTISMQDDTAFGWEMTFVLKHKFYS